MSLSPAQFMQLAALAGIGNGTPGKDGNSMIPTTGAPSNSVGSDGWYAIDAAAQVIYGPKGQVTAGVWPPGISFAPTVSGILLMQGSQAGGWTSAVSTSGDQTLLTVPIPANAMGSLGNMRVRQKWTIAGSSGNSTTIAAKCVDSAGNLLLNMSGTFGSSNQINEEAEVQNQGAQNSQFIQTVTVTNGPFGTASATPIIGTVDYSQAQSIRFIANTAGLAGVTMSLRSWAIEIRNP